MDAISRGKCPRIAIVALIIVLVVGCGVWIAIVGRGSYPDAQRSYSEVQELAHEEPPETEASVEEQPTLSVDWNELNTINPETVGWVRIDDTRIDYPIAQGVADEYLYKLFDGTPSDVGSIFLDPFNTRTLTDKVSFIYGHNLVDGSMLSDVAKYSDKEYFDTHGQVVVATPDMELHLRPWACCVVDGMDAKLRQVDGWTKERWESYCAEVLNTAVVTSADVSTTTAPEQLVCFVTCSYQTADSRTLLFCSTIDTNDMQ